MARKVIVRRRAAPKHSEKRVAPATKPKARALQPENFGYPIELRRNAASGFNIVCGCRNFTLAEAKEHWRARASSPRCIGGGLPGCYCNRSLIERGQKMLKLLPLLAQRARRYGWKPVKR